MPEQKSVFDHSAQYHSNGADVLVYKALVPIPCYRCNPNIMPGDLFRRSASKNGKTVGIRYVFCRQCEPFEKRPEFLTQKQSRLNESAIQEQLLLQNEDQGDISWKKLAGYELVQINLDEYGNASFTDQMGLPLHRGNVAWIIHVAKRDLELYTDEEIESEWHAQDGRTRKSSYRLSTQKEELYTWLHLPNLRWWFSQNS
jgi:hypothetical protein